MALNLGFSDQAAEHYTQTVRLSNALATGANVIPITSPTEEAP